MRLAEAAQAVALSAPQVHIVSADPQGDDALELLREAAIEARQLYPELHVEAAPWPTNPPLAPDAAFVLACVNDTPVGCGALRRIDDLLVEVRRMYVLRAARRSGIARAILVHLKQVARDLDYGAMRLETGCRQLPAMALYGSFGFNRIAPFGEYASDPTSVCFELPLRARRRPSPTSVRP